MIVAVWLDRSSKPLVYTDVVATYQKGDALCVRYEAETGPETEKIPMANIFKWRESDFVTSTV